MSILLEASAIALLAGGVCLFGMLTILYFHEVGHYLAGRLLLGVPSNEITIVISWNYWYIMLRDDDGWIDPTIDSERFFRRYLTFDPDEKWILSFFAAGLLAQGVAVVSISWLVAEVFLRFVAVVIILGSLSLVGIYVYDEISNFSDPDAFSGDLAVLWLGSPTLCVGTIFATVGLHLTALYLVLRGVIL